VNETILIHVSAIMRRTFSFQASNEDSGMEEPDVQMLLA